ncbi:MAG: hypothetical protein KC736_03995 [Candidatus Moranbacteria bacterium]|nr:hypothetical protein [Candidatus Moranbacteria bacterium]
MKKRNHKNIEYFTRNLTTVFGIVLIWRGMWYVLDEVDKLAFGGSGLATAIIGIVVGTILLYWPDRDLKELEKL